MNQSTPAPASVTDGIRLLLILAAIVVVVLGMKIAASIITPIAMALIVSISMTPILQSHRLLSCFRCSSGHGCWVRWERCWRCL